MAKRIFCRKLSPKKAPPPPLKIKTQRVVFFKFHIFALAAGAFYKRSGENTSNFCKVIKTLSFSKFKDLIPKLLSFFDYRFQKFSMLYTCINVELPKKVS